MMVRIDVLAGLGAMTSWGAGDYTGALLSRRTQLRGFVWSTLIATLIVLMWGMFSSGSIFVPVEGVVRIGGVQLLSMTGSVSFYRALGVGKVSFVTPLSSGWAIISVLTAMLVYDEAPTTSQLLGGVLIVVGVITSSLSWRTLLKEFRFVASDPSTPWVILAIVFWGLAYAHYGPLSETYGWFALNWWSWLINSIIVLVAILVIRRPFMIATSDRRAWMQATLVAAFSVGANACYTIGVERGLTAVAAPVASMYPLVAIALAGIFLRERLSRTQMAGGGLALIGLLGMTLGGS
ncbi:MAG: EamA family transporter [bacterium]